jgi:hypothetical protein
LRSALFFLLNRCSETGLVSSGNLDQTNFTPLAVREIKSFRSPETFSLEYIKQPVAELSTLIKDNRAVDYIYVPAGTFTYNLFEDGKNYGPEQTRINNRELKKLLKTDSKFILHYNSHKALKNFYKDYNTTMIDEFGKITDDFQDSQEIIVTNF